MAVGSTLEQRALQYVRFRLSTPTVACDKILPQRWIITTNGEPRTFHWDRAEGRQRGGILVEEPQPAPHQLRGLGSAMRLSSPAGFGAEPRPPRGFPLFSALRMASPDTVMLLIVDYHAVIGGQDPRAPPPLAYAPNHDSSSFIITPWPSLLFTHFFSSWWSGCPWRLGSVSIEETRGVIRAWKHSTSQFYGLKRLKRRNVSWNVSK